MIRFDHPLCRGPDGPRIIQSLSRCPHPRTGMPDANSSDLKYEAMVDDVKKATVLIIGY